MSAFQAHNYQATLRLEANSEFVFNQHDLLDEEKGTPLYWFWDGHRKVDQICAAVGASHFTKSQKEALARIVMHANYEAQRGNRRIHYTRSKSSEIWSLDSVKNLPFYSYHLITHAIDFLEYHGLIEHWKGIAGTKGRQSDFRATNLLVLCIARISYEMLAPANPVIIRNSENMEIAIPKGQKVDRIGKRVDAQNKLILETEFTTFAHLKAPMRRIYRESIFRLGRFYTVGASWQNVRRETRTLIELDGQKTTLLDYSACNPHIAYRIIETAPPEGIYECGNFYRADVKLGLMILLNAKCKRDAIFALASHKGFGLGRFSNGHGGDIISRRNVAKAIIEKLEILHAPLLEANMFYGSGLDLMHAESNIADRVMTELRKQRIVCLPIHDGFIVKVEHRFQLEDAMRQHSKINGQPPIPISREY